MGHTKSVTHGLTSTRDDLLQFEGARVAANELFDNAVQDDGGLENIPARRKSLLEYRAELHRRVLQLSHALDKSGIRDGSGKLRVNWLVMLKGLIAECRALDTTLGLSRRERDVDTLDGFLARRADEQRGDG